MSTSTRLNDLSDTARDMWRTRPVRSPHDRKIAGVCGGIGQRYGIDPTIARIAFVVTIFFGGTGIGLYALAWLVMRRPEDTASMLESLGGRGRNSDSKFLAVVLLLVALGTIPAVLTGGPTALIGSGMVSFVAFLLGWYALHLRTPEPLPAWWDVTTPRSYGAPGPHTAPRTDSDDPGPTDVDGHGAAADHPAHAEASTRPPADDATPLDPTQHPSWDPLGAAPFAWDLPEPGQAPEEPKKRSRLTSVTLGLAVIATGIMVALAHYAEIPYLDFPKIAAVPLAVIGAGLVVGSLTRKGYGLLVFTAPLLGLVLLSSLADPQAFHDWERENQRETRNVSLTEIEPGNEHMRFDVGSVRVDLSDLEVTEDQELTIENGIGSVEVILPEDVRVSTTCHSAVGSIDCHDSPVRGNGPVLDLEVTNSVGSVTVQ